MENNKKLISIVSPAYNEEKNVPLMVEEVKKVMGDLQKDYDFEYILVNDGSMDNTWEAIVNESKKDERIKGLCFSRNFGHQMALTAGLDHAKGDAVIYCDSDLQQPPEIFPKLIKEWEEGSDVVHTKRLETEGEPFFKKLMSKYFYKFVNMFSSVKMEEGMADFKLLDRKVLYKITSMREHNRFLRGIVPWVGFNSSVVEYNAKKRLYGKPSYNFKRNLSFAKSGILAFSVKPLKYIGYLGLLLIVLSTPVLVYGGVTIFILQRRFLSPNFLIGIFNTFLMGLVLSSLGIIALYIHYIYYEVMNRPLYIVADKTFENEKQ
ncbi:glycosyltransferase family 2 protein [Patescibacteria group bacterium]|nr:glycosyltransferase family 2 protein [Patescibacteria group bacterium]